MTMQRRVFARMTAGGWAIGVFRDGLFVWTWNAWPLTSKETEA